MLNNPDSKHREVDVVEEKNDASDEEDQEDREEEDENDNENEKQLNTQWVDWTCTNSLLWPRGTVPWTTRPRSV
jgi:hypothetical protein